MTAFSMYFLLSISRLEGYCTGARIFMCLLSLTLYENLHRVSTRQDGREKPDRLLVASCNPATRKRWYLQLQEREVIYADTRERWYLQLQDRGDIYSYKTEVISATTRERGDIYRYKRELICAAYLTARVTVELVVSHQILILESLAEHVSEVKDICVAAFLIKV